MLYKLSATLAAHTSDVRALSSPTDDLILSASRDSTAIYWKRSSPGPKFAPETTFKAGGRYVNSVAYLPPTSDAPQGYVVTGGQDTVINIYPLQSANDDPAFSLLGHTENICALDTSPGGSIISGSWDRTAKVWKNFQLAFDLKGHQQSVWAVLAVDDERSLTGSADKTIKFWQQNKVLATYTGHTDAVRGLALVPDLGFASCSNDSEVRVWTLHGDALYTLSGHTSFVYSVSVLPNGDIVSGGEDRSVRVWKDGECSQVIVHPAISVWAVSALPNGDIVSGCSDGIVRVFSASEDRWASREDIQEYEQKVASQALPTQQIGDVKKSDLPGPEALFSPGKKPGEVKMIKNNGIVEAHQWDNSSGLWQKIGDVVDAVGQGRRQLYEGKEYDYVFDVDIQDGVPPLKLPYNVTENPFGAAQRFLERNELPLTYVDEVVRFIEKNTAGVNIGTGGEEYSDPYTGASRYRSSPNSATSAPTSSFVDPYTGASRYIGATQPTPSAGAGAQYMDPFTGASRYSGAAQASTPSVTKVLPVPQPIAFKQANVTAMQAKLHQLDEALRSEISTSSLAMYPAEITAVDEVFVYLSGVTASPPRRPTSNLTASHVEAVIQILDRWPSSQLFPVIDLSRLLAGFSPESLVDPSLKSRFFEALFKAAEWGLSWSLPLSKPRETNVLLLLRTFANVFQGGVSLTGQASPWVGQVLEAFGQIPYSSLTKAHRVAFATVLFNISCVSFRSPLPVSLRDNVLALILKILESESMDSEVVYRAEVALGNIIHATNSAGFSVNAAMSGEIVQCIRALPLAFPEDRVKTVTSEINALL